MGVLLEAAEQEAAARLTPDQLPNQYQKLQLGHRLMMLGHTWKKLASNRKLLDSYRTGMLSDLMAEQPAGKPASEAAMTGNDMLDGSLVLGNVTVTPIQPQQPQQQAAAQPARAGVGKGALLAATLAAAGLGGGLGIGIPWMLGAFDKPESATLTDTDTDTQYSLQIEGTP